MVTLRMQNMEAEMKERGRERGRSLMTRDYERNSLAETPAGIALAKRSLDPLIEGIKTWRADALKGHITRTAQAAKIMKDLDPEMLAYITVRTVITCASQGQTLWGSARMISNNIEMELAAKEFRKANEALYTSSKKTIEKGTDNPERVGKALRSAAFNSGEVEPIWDNAEKLRLGTKLIELCIEHVGIIETQHTYQNRKTRLSIIFTKKIEEWFHNFNQMAYLGKPFYLPTDYKPEPWTDVDKGAYKTIQVQVVTKPTETRLDALRDADMSSVYEGLNTLQETPWQINLRVLDTMSALWESDAEFEFMPRHDDIPIPSAPQEVKDDVEGGTIRKEWRRKVRAIYEENTRSRSKRFEFARAINLAKQLASKDEIYFPHRLDFRGRAYAMATTLNPQGPDNARGLIMFAAGKPLDERAKWWLGIHGANLFGEDKISLQERYQWALNFHQAALEISRDPLATTGIWGEAEDPWQFLAWCFEWAEKDTPGFISHLPVHLDGSCNGIQHYSAMLKDPVGGSAVNLTPSEKPNDIYQEVADKVIETLKTYTCDGDPQDYIYAQGWLKFDIDRKITKRPVMVLPYGGTMFSCVEYVRDAIQDKLKDGAPCAFGHKEQPKAIAWLGMIVWESISKVVIAAREAMDWLQEVSDIASEHEVPLRWTTPSGFVVHQEYKKVRHRRVNTQFQGSIIKFRSYEEIDPIDRRKQRTALAPNFVHSLDASTLVMTILTGKKLGIEHFTMIHDSYATLAADTDKLSAAIRSTFVYLYQDHNVLQNFKDEIQAALPEGVTLPPIPQQGSLDIQDVMESEYFFA